MLWPWSTIKKLREYAEGWEQLYRKRSDTLYEAYRENAALREQLASAQKNDTRDPSTGRYVKADQS